MLPDAESRIRSLHFLKGVVSFLVCSARGDRIPLQEVLDKEQRAQLLIQTRVEIVNFRHNNCGLPSNHLEKLQVDTHQLLFFFGKIIVGFAPRNPCRPLYAIRKCQEIDWVVAT